MELNILLIVVSAVSYGLGYLLGWRHGMHTMALYVLRKLRGMSV